MSTTEQAYGLNYDLSSFVGNVSAPADLDPNAKAFEQAPAGVHIMEIADGEIVPNKEFKCKVDGAQQSFYLTQWRPKLRISGGQYDGAGAIDFLPVPTPGQAMPTMLANRWVNHVQAFGLELPKEIGPDGKPRITSLVPAGFSFQMLKGRKAEVKIVQDTDKDGQPKLNDKGEPRTKPAFFGYSRPDAKAPANGNTSTAPPATAPATSAPAPIAQKPPMAPSVPAAAKDDFEL